jgi:hypothetical protein
MFVYRRSVRVLVVKQGVTGEIARVRLPLGSDETVRVTGSWTTNDIGDPRSFLLSALCIVLLAPW